MSEIIASLLLLPMSSFRYTSHWTRLVIRSFVDNTFTATRVTVEWSATKGAIMVIAIVLVILAILLGLAGLLFTAVKWLLIVAVVLLVAGAVAGFIGRGKSKSVR